MLDSNPKIKLILKILWNVQDESYSAVLVADLDANVCEYKQIAPGIKCHRSFEKQFVSGAVEPVESLSVFPIPIIAIPAVADLPKAV